MDFLTFTDCQDINIRGKGVVEGLGYDWWVREWKRANPHERPQLLKYQRVQNSEISGVTWKNSPRFHLELKDIDSVYIHDIEIFVDIWKQKDLIRQAQGTAWLANTLSFYLGDIVHDELIDRAIDWLAGDRTEASLATMPLNTDGIDPSGSNVTIRNVKITNDDDAVAVKPATKTY